MIKKKLKNYTWHVRRTEKFRYPINDVILKRGKELVKTVLVTVWENRYKINGTFNHKTFNADHIRLTPSKHTRSLASEGEFLYWSLHKLRYKCNIMLGSGRREAAESVKEETTAGVRQAYGSQDLFSARRRKIEHTQNAHSHAGRCGPQEKHAVATMKLAFFSQPAQVPFSQQWLD